MRFYNRYTRLYRPLTAWQMNADNEKRLATKCRQLNEDLTGASARVTAALRLSEEDQFTITALRKELEKHWRQIDASHDKARHTQLCYILKALAGS